MSSQEHLEETESHDHLALGENLWNRFDVIFFCTMKPILTYYGIAGLISRSTVGLDAYCTEIRWGFAKRMRSTLHKHFQGFSLLHLFGMDLVFLMRF